jgi:hypothetical protein
LGNCSKDDVAYGYLSESAAFPYGEALNNILKSWVYRCDSDTSNFEVAIIYLHLKNKP